MKTTKLHIIKATFLLTLGFAPLAAGQYQSPTNSDKDVVASALELAKTRHYAAALSRLESADPAIKTQYEFRFTKARILTWAKLYDHAEREFKVLAYLYPDNADIRVSYGYLELFRGNLDQAEWHFDGVLKLYPTYKDAQAGLVRVRAARQAE
ncbi:tetratricopeptide repeat protein [Hellea balneolensis]|uniref:tetratricopeptide repeat protein n=1 Tax=Hellea balneolensis TaxID=287478 RepID=UPI000403F022|nr:hypothetical protein [Hellea balneolensis]